MKSFARFILTAVSLALCLCAAMADEPQVRVNRLGDKAIVVSASGIQSMENVAAFAAEKGLVVIDTTTGPGKAAAVRKAIEQAFGRKDFLYVINTHDHVDHTSGNQVFPDARIVGQERIVEAMRRFEDEFPGFIATRKGWIEGLTGRLQTLDPDSEQAASDRELIASIGELLSELEEGYVVTPPELTFSDRLTLHLGDLTVNLIYYGAAHTDNDILVHIPEIGALMVGDLHRKKFLPYIDQQGSDPTPWLAALETVLEGGAPVEHVVPGHGEIMTAAELRAQRDYLRDLHEGIAAGFGEGLSLAEMKERLSFESRFKHLDHLTRVSDGEDLHAQNLEALWRRNQESGVSRLQSLIDDKGIDAAVTEYRADIRNNNKYYADEGEFNRLGYRLLYGARIPEAVGVLKLGAEAFPESWNMHDSLGEAHMYAGQKEEAEASYTKSLELNPENENGRMKLEDMEIQVLEARMETREPSRYAPGEQTGLKGPYLGQEPPGLEPKVFAPGIVSTMGGHEFSTTFSPDGKEFYFNRGPNIWVSRLEEDGWTAPARAPFNGRSLDHEAHITADGKRLFFGSRRPRPGVTDDPYGIWVMERAEGGWAEPRYHGPGMYVTTARNGNLYVTDVSRQPDSGVLVRSRLVDGRYTELEELAGGVNSPDTEWHPCIALDESFLIFDSDRPGGLGGNGDFYVSFRREDGSWGDPVHMEAISSPGTEMTASLTPDGKYIFFYAHHDIYWVSAEIVEKYRPARSD
jgi:glyoxylase-like metal-dependent hydrolase (beta-lactamase superfamily II)